MDSWVLPVVSTLALGAILWTMHQERRGRDSRDFGSPKERFATSKPPRSEDAAKREVVGLTPKSPSYSPKPARPTFTSLPTDVDRIDAVLASVVDADVPAQSTMGESVPYTEQEIRLIVSNVLERVNQQSDLDLRLVALDGVRKTVDSYKTLLYNVSAPVYSTTRNVGIKIDATIVVPSSNRMYIKELKTYNAPMPEDSVRGSRGPHKEETYAEWIPVL